jgi:dihydroorotate dehydrogenase electron transfer subunit
MGCVLPAVGNDGITRMVRACVDGPVFRGDLVRWDDVGTIPFDALGAPGWKPRPGASGESGASGSSRSSGSSGSSGVPGAAGDSGAAGERSHAG